MIEYNLVSFWISFDFGFVFYRGIWIKARVFLLLDRISTVKHCLGIGILGTSHLNII